MTKQVKPKIRQARLNMAARLGRTVSVSEVHRTTGIAISTIRRLESGDALGIEWTTLARLAEFFGAETIDELFELAEGEAGGEAS
ncbi:MAG TPA: helix-turn-helix transcriptional regulator [Herpetosiphonaceae bacterium]